MILLAKLLVVSAFLFPFFGEASQETAVTLLQKFSSCKKGKRCSLSSKELDSVNQLTKGLSSQLRSKVKGKDQNETVNLSPETSYRVISLGTASSFYPQGKKTPLFSKILTNFLLPKNQVFVPEDLNLVFGVKHVHFLIDQVEQMERVIRDDQKKRDIASSK